MKELDAGVTYTFGVKAVDATGKLESMEAEKSCTTSKTITSENTGDSFVKQIGDLKTAVTDVKAECTRGIQGLLTRHVIIVSMQGIYRAGV